MCFIDLFIGFLASSGRDGNIVIYDERQSNFTASNIIVGAHILPNKSKLRINLVCKDKN